MGRLRLGWGCPAASDSGYGRDTRPVINVTWPDAQQYVAWLSRMTGQPYRLLTETEWEYAARAGTTTVYIWGDDIGNGNANCMDAVTRGKIGRPHRSDLSSPMHSGSTTWPGTCGNGCRIAITVATNGAPTDASAWMSGDCSRHVIRGGSWYSDPRSLSTAARLGNATDGRGDNVGFRIARTLDLGP